MIAIEFDKPRNIFFDLEAVRDLEVAMGGLPLGRIIDQLSELGLNATVVSLWAGLKHEDRTLTPNLVRKRLETHLKNGGLMRPLADAISDGLEQTGLFRTAASVEDAAEKNGRPEPPPTTTS